MEPNTQGPNGTDSQDGQGGNGSDNGGTPAGVQKRFDEMTAQRHAVEAQLREREAQLTHLMGQFAEITNRSMALQQAPQERVEIDPEQAKVVEAIVSPMMRKVEAALAQLGGAVAAQQVQTASSNDPPEVQAKAKAYYDRWIQEGKTGWKPEDAARFARAEWLEKEYARLTSNGQRQDFNNGGGIVQGTSAPPPVNRQALPAVPPDIASWPLNAQINYWAKRVGDKPL